MLSLWTASISPLMRAASLPCSARPAAARAPFSKSIAGIVPLQQGQVILDGQDITRTPVHKRGTVILFQEMRLFPNMTVLENVAFPLKMQGIGKTQRLKQAEAFLQQVQMGGYSRRRVYELSGGQQQRGRAGPRSGGAAEGAAAGRTLPLPWTKTCAARCARWLPSCTAALG